MLSTSCSPSCAAATPPPTSTIYSWDSGRRQQRLRRAHGCSSPPAMGRGLRRRRRHARRGARPRRCHRRSIALSTCRSCPPTSWRERPCTQRPEVAAHARPPSQRDACASRTRPPSHPLPRTVPRLQVCMARPRAAASAPHPSTARRPPARRKGRRAPRGPPQPMGATAGRCQSVRPRGGARSGSSARAVRWNPSG